MNHSDIAASIKSVIEEKGFTSNQALKNSGAGEDMLTNMKKKAKPQYPSIIKIILLAEFLDVSIDYLIGRKLNGVKKVENEYINLRNEYGFSQERFLMELCKKYEFIIDDFNSYLKIYKYLEGEPYNFEVDNLLTLQKNVGSKNISLEVMDNDKIEILKNAIEFFSSDNIKKTRNKEAWINN